MFAGCATHTPIPATVSDLVNELNSSLPAGWHASVNKFVGEYEIKVGIAGINVEISHKTPVLISPQEIPNAPVPKLVNSDSGPHLEIFYFNFLLIDHTTQTKATHEYNGHQFFLFDSRISSPPVDEDFNRQCDNVLKTVESKLKRRIIAQPTNPPYSSPAAGSKR